MSRIFIAGGGKFPGGWIVGDETDIDAMAEVA